jgi:hypothetical protein
MPNTGITEFAKIIIEQVRDEAIRSNDRELLPIAKSPVAKRWREVATTKNFEKIAKVMIPDIVDDTLFYLLHAIDEGSLKLSFISSDSEKIDLEKEGRSELAGWYMGSGGWRSKFSKERFIDDFSKQT